MRCLCVREVQQMIYICKYNSPLGSITMTSDGEALTGLMFDGQKYFTDMSQEKCKPERIPVFDETKRWLDIYFQGKCPDFTPPLLFDTTPFRRKVWELLLSVPYGKTVTYGELADIIAKDMGIRKMAAQAVGGAVGHNAVAIIVPCHRVVGADGSLTGYAGGVDKKLKLLTLEGTDISHFIF